MCDVSLEELMILCGSVKGLIKREFEAFVLDADTAIRRNSDRS